MAKPCGLSGRHMVAVPFAFAELNLIELGNKLDGKAREKEEDGGKEKEVLMDYKKAPPDTPSTITLDFEYKQMPE